MISGCQTCSTAPNRVFSGISEEIYQHSWKKICDWNMFVPSRWFIQHRPHLTSLKTQHSLSRPCRVCQTADLQSVPAQVHRRKDIIIISLLNKHMSNLADQPLFPCPSIAKYWQLHKRNDNMMTKPGKKFWNGRNATSLFSKDIINTITWLPSLKGHLLHWAQPALSAHQSCIALQALLQSLPPHCRSRNRCSERWWSQENKFPVHGTWL